MRSFLLASALLFSACPGTSGVGLACKTHDDCKVLSEGYCSRVELCTRVCDDEHACPPGAACSAEGGRRVCLPSCATAEDCLAGFDCQDRSGVQVCRFVDPLAQPKL